MFEKEIGKFKNEGEVYLRIKVSPNSSETIYRDRLEDDTIKIDIKAQAEKGKANKELIKYLSKVFEVNKNNVKILSGLTDRLKLVKVIID
ncbi:MAG: DUF167 domain-containing protein [Patescibacteria group bacterium]|nr:DUF167 domain-containing protein [Patescibacteria group bacterium]